MTSKKTNVCTAFSKLKSNSNDVDQSVFLKLTLLPDARIDFVVLTFTFNLGKCTTRNRLGMKLKNTYLASTSLI